MNSTTSKKDQYYSSIEEHNLELPKLPLPELEETMTEYLREIKTTLTPQQNERYRAIVEEFSSPSGLGPKLHHYLAKKRDAENNWAYNYWLHDMYLDLRHPLPCNQNPGMVLPPRKFHTVKDEARFAAQVIKYTMDHKEYIDSGKLEKGQALNRERDESLCMAQFYRILGSCRRPGYVRDSLYLPERRNDQHVIVLCRNQMYYVPIKSKDHGRLSQNEIESQLLFILNDASGSSEKQPPVGILTAEPRHVWAYDYRVLLQQEPNRRNIELIEQSLMLICFDDPIPTSFNAKSFCGATESVHRAGLRDETNMGHQMLHGGGSSFNSANRWFDKTIEVVISNDGAWGLCYEHSTSEGIALVLLLEQILSQIENADPEDECVANRRLPSPKLLEWKITPELTHRMSLAGKAIDRQISDLDFLVYRYRGYGKNFIKNCKLSPDAYIQLAMQLAHYMLHGYVVTTYESASTRRFLLGRVDCIRSASGESLDWVKAMCEYESTITNDNTDEVQRKKEHLRELLRTAEARQKEIMVMNNSGHGVDIPLLCLREACKELNNGELCELFTDECYSISQCFLLSTSQIACKTDSFMGYSPVTPKGYGCSYNPRCDEIVFCPSAYYSAGHTSAARFAKSLKESLDNMKKLLES